jgi:hypothetical protein
MNIFTLDESLLIWKVALESGYVLSPVWVDWADKQILDLDSPPLWLLELSVLDTVEKASMLFWRHSRQINQSSWNRIECTELYLGFIYLRFERGDLEPGQLLMLAGKFADRINYRIDCSVFFLLFYKIDGDNLTSNILKERVRELFKPMVKSARYWLSKLPAMVS